MASNFCQRGKFPKMKIKILAVFLLVVCFIGSPALADWSWATYNAGTNTIVGAGTSTCTWSLQVWYGAPGSPSTFTYTSSGTPSGGTGTFGPGATIFGTDGYSGSILYINPGSVTYTLPAGLYYSDTGGTGTRTFSYTGADSSQWVSHTIGVQSYAPTLSPCTTNIVYTIKNNSVLSEWFTLATPGGSEVAGARKYVPPGSVYQTAIVNIPCTNANNYAAYSLGMNPDANGAAIRLTNQPQAFTGFYTNADLALTNGTVVGYTTNAPSTTRPTDTLGQVSSNVVFSASSATNTSQAIKDQTSIIYDATQKGIEQAHNDAQAILGALTNRNLLGFGSNVWVGNWPSNFTTLPSTNSSANGFTNYATESSLSNVTNKLHYLVTNTMAAQAKWDAAAGVLSNTAWTNGGFNQAGNVKSAYLTGVGTAPGFDSLSGPDDGSIDLVDAGPHGARFTMHINSVNVSGLATVRSLVIPIMSWVIFLVTFMCVLNHTTVVMKQVTQAKQMEGNKQQAEFLGIGGNLDVVSGLAYAAIVVAFVVSMPVALVAYYNTFGTQVSSVSHAVASASSSPIWKLVTTLVPFDSIISAFGSWFVFRFYVAEPLCTVGLIIVLFLIS